MPQWDFRCVRCNAVKTATFPSVEAADSRAVWCENPNCNPKFRSWMTGPVVSTVNGKECVGPACQTLS